MDLQNYEKYQKYKSKYLQIKQNRETLHINKSLIGGSNVSQEIMDSVTTDKCGDKIAIATILYNKVFLGLSKEVLDQLNSLTFKVRRTSGAIEDDWILFDPKTHGVSNTLPILIEHDMTGPQIKILVVKILEDGNIMSKNINFSDFTTQIKDKKLSEHELFKIFFSLSAIPQGNYALL